jgi:23S rRNA pseudoU1915 N3-methylase RlmH
MKIVVYYVGKPRDPHANRMAEDFIQRSSHYGRCEMREVVPARFDPWAKHPTATKILLDPGGKNMDSAAFAKLVSGAQQEARDLVFLIGAAGLERERRPAAFSLRVDHAARIGPGGARRTDLSRLRNPGRSSIPKIVGGCQTENDLYTDG